MSKISVLNEKFQPSGELALPDSYEKINSHNLYLYVKSYLASIRSNTAHTKSRSTISGGGKKPWRQKGRGGARAGSTRTPVWVGGAVAFGPKSDRNYNQKINKKQKRLALEFALNEKATNGKLFALESIKIESGKTKDAAALIKTAGVRDALIILNSLEASTLLAFRNLQNCYVVDASEVNAYLVAVYGAVIAEKSALESIIKEG